MPGGFGEGNVSVTQNKLCFLRATFLPSYLPSLLTNPLPKLQSVSPSERFLNVLRGSDIIQMTIFLSDLSVALFGE